MMNNLSQFIGKSLSEELWAEINRVLGQSIVNGNGWHTITIETLGDGTVTDLKLNSEPRWPKDGG